MIAAAKTKVEPGIYRSMPDHEYRAIDALSNSDLVEWARGEGARKIDPRAATFGSAFHMIVLEPEIAASKIVGLEPKQKRSSYEGPDDALVLTNSDYAKLMGCYQSVKTHPQLGELMKLARADRDRCELAVVWRDEQTGLLLKAKLDQHTDNWLWDWKTTNSCPDSFARSVGAFGYAMQAAGYLDGAKQSGIDVKGFRFACCSKRADKGHVCWVHELDEPWLVAGIQERRRLLTLYKRYEVSP